MILMTVCLYCLKHNTFDYSFTHTNNRYDNISPALAVVISHCLPKETSKLYSKHSHLCSSVESYTFKYFIRISATSFRYIALRRSISLATVADVDLHTHFFRTKSVGLVLQFVESSSSFLHLKVVQVGHITNSSSRHILRSLLYP